MRGVRGGNNCQRAAAPVGKNDPGWRIWGSGQNRSNAAARPSQQTTSNRRRREPRNTEIRKRSRCFLRKILRGSRISRPKIFLVGAFRMPVTAGQKQILPDNQTISALKSLSKSRNACDCCAQSLKFSKIEPALEEIYRRAVNLANCRPKITGRGTKKQKWPQRKLWQLETWISRMAISA